MFHSASRPAALWRVVSLDVSLEKTCQRHHCLISSDPVLGRPVMMCSPNDFCRSTLFPDEQVSIGWTRS